MWLAILAVVLGFIVVCVLMVGDEILKEWPKSDVESEWKQRKRIKRETLELELEQLRNNEKLKRLEIQEQELKIAKLQKRLDKNEDADFIYKTIK